ncbi:MAG: SEC-C domain-containing protein [Clostridia bacterium]|nr:SEC-C domain-containing protein [Clostridia bacterium]
MLKDLILRYFDAFSNLYGMIPMKRAYRIIEKQNPELNITKEQFAEIVSNINTDRKHYAIRSEEEVYGENADEADLFDKLLIAEYVITFGDPEDYERLVFEQGDRPFYVPEKDELLKYEDSFYYERTKHIANLENYLRDDLGLSRYKEIVEEFTGMLVIDDDEPDEVIAWLKRMGGPKFKEFSDKQQAQKFFMLYTNLRNHTRKHTHRGHTPFELDDCYVVDAIIENSIQSKVKTPSKNGKCPCGSGKKYKRCCGKE